MGPWLALIVRHRQAASRRNVDLAAKDARILGAVMLVQAAGVEVD